MPHSTHHHRAADAIRREKLMSKLLSRVAGELGRLQIPVTTALLDEARDALHAKWSEHGGSLSDGDVKSVVKSLKAAQRSRSVMDRTAATLPELVPTHRAGTPVVDAARRDMMSESPSTDAIGMLLHTTKKQRMMMADHEWIEAAQRDRVDGLEAKRQEKERHFSTMLQQKSILDRQMEERQRQKEFERLEKLRRQQEVNEAVEAARELQRQEQVRAAQKAQRERDFREQQQREVEAERERQRREEHNEQVRMVLLNKEELRRQREAELARKAREQTEWKKTLIENQKKLQEKEVERERLRELDRVYQKQLEQEEERKDRERGEAKQRREARTAYFTKLANGVAQLFAAKEQDHTAKIDAEYERQMQRAAEDERDRQQRSKERLQHCMMVREQQMAEKKQKQEDEREEARRYAAQLKQQARETVALEEAKKHHARMEAIRTKEFLSTQLQLAHFKETRPLETSIARPASQALSPSRFTPSISPERGSR